MEWLWWIFYVIRKQLDLQQIEATLLQISRGR